MAVVALDAFAESCPHGRSAWDTLRNLGRVLLHAELGTIITHIARLLCAQVTLRWN